MEEDSCVQQIYLMQRCRLDVYSCWVRCYTTHTHAQGNAIGGFGYMGEGWCDTAGGDFLPYFFKNGNPTNDDGAFCSGQCGSVPGCQGFHYHPSSGWCYLSGSTFTASSSGIPTGFKFDSRSGRGLITQVDSGYSGYFCYESTAGNIPGTCTAPPSPALPCVGPRWPPCPSPYTFGGGARAWHLTTPRCAVRSVTTPWQIAAKGASSTVPGRSAALVRIHRGMRVGTGKGRKGLRQHV